MKPVLTIIAAMAFAVLAAACGAGSGQPEQQSQQDPQQGPQQDPQQDPQQVMTGTGVDSNETNLANSIPIATTIVTWKLTQTGDSVSGTVTTQSIDPLGTTCNSCHRSRTGTLSGTISGTTLTWTASFPADAANDPTPSCTATLSGTISDITGNSPSGSYSGEDSCEKLYTDGTLALARMPQPAP
jgi:hypothetical protein